MITIDHDRVRVDSVHHPPSFVLIIDSKLVTSRPDARHGSRVGHREGFTALQLPEQVSGLDAGHL
jgi:hypothetical protein